MLVHQMLHHAALMAGQPEDWSRVLCVFLTEGILEVCVCRTICWFTIV